MNNPFVSVIVPVYNVDKYLSNCLESLVNQTFRDIEIICINDCSTDKSLAILKQYASKDKRIRIINLEKNGGVSNARNIGIAQSKGEYLSFIDSDDTVDLDFFEKLSVKAKISNADIVKANIRECLINGKMQFDIFKTNEKIRNLKGRLFFFTYFYCAIYKKSMIRKNHISFSTKLTNGEDGLFLVKTVIEADNIELIDNTYYNYRRRLGSANSDILPDKALRSLIKAYDLVLNIVNKNYYDKGYLNIYFFYIDNTVKNIFRTDNKELKLICIDKIFNYIKKSKNKKELLNTLNTNYPIICKYISDNNIENLKLNLSKLSYRQFMAENLRFKISVNML